MANVCNASTSRDTYTFSNRKLGKFGNALTLLQKYTKPSTRHLTKRRITRAHPEKQINSATVAVDTCRKIKHI